MTASPITVALSRDRSAEAVAAALADEAVAVRERAAQTAAELARATRRETYERSLDDEQFDPLPVDWSFALDPDPVTVLADRLQEEDVWIVRNEIVDALAEIPDDRAREALAVAAEHDRNEEIREAAARALGR